jgi:Protein of unknown function (DUF3124)
MNLKPCILACLTIASIIITACSDRPVSLQQQPSSECANPLPTVTLDRTKIVTGQTVYVPIYSHIYHYNNRDNAINLSATLSIRNTDLKNSMIITAVRYYDTKGQLLRNEIPSPVELRSLASTDFFIAANDTSGGVGANFIVEWVAQTMVEEPIIEAVMISTSSTQGISFISRGKVLQQHGIKNLQKNKPAAKLGQLSRAITRSGQNVPITAQQSRSGSLRQC